MYDRKTMLEQQKFCRRYLELCGYMGAVLRHKDSGFVGELVGVQANPCSTERVVWLTLRNLEGESEVARDSRIEILDVSEPLRRLQSSDIPESEWPAEIVLFSGMQEISAKGTPSEGAEVIVNLEVR